MMNEALRGATMDGQRLPESHADYRFFRFTALATARLTLAGLFFIVWALLFAEGHRWETSIFLGSTTMMLLVVSLIASMVAYMLYKRRGGRIEKGPRSAEELLALSEPARERESGKDVAGHEHERRDDPEIP